MQPHDNTLPTKVERTCQFCSKTFIVKRAVVWIGRGQYCSHACHDAAKIRPLSERFWSHVKITDGCWLWMGASNRKGYGHLSIGKRGQGMILAHRLSWELRNGTIPDGLFACHRCDNPQCVNPDHLFLGDAADNFADLAKKGLNLRGEQCVHAKLTAPQVLEIRRRYKAGGISQYQLAEEYHVSRGAICDIVRYKKWSHLP